MRSTSTVALRLGGRWILGAILAVPALGLAQDGPRLSGTAPAVIGNPRRTQVVDVVERVSPAVVNIHSERTVALNSPEVTSGIAVANQRVNGMGTGCVIDPRGYVITNHHVVDDVQVLRVKLHDGTQLLARVIARDPEADLALIKIDPPKPLPTIPLGTANDLMRGEPVIAIGNAFGYEHTVTSGVVSALKRDVSLNKEVNYKQLIQTDASINPGNSGGPLLNIHGELIGVNVAIRAGAQGIGFAIPVDSMLRTATELMSVRRRTGFSHGLTLKDMVDSTESPVKRWAVVERVEAGSAGERAGLKPGDILDKAGDYKILVAYDLERALLERPLGDKIALVAKRGSEDVAGDLNLRIGERQALPQGQGDVVWRRLGIRLQTVGADSVNRVNPQLHGGLMITDVSHESPAFRAGFRRGDILIGLHQWETVSLENVAYVLNHQELATFAPVRFFRIRAGELQRGFLPQIETP